MLLGGGEKGGHDDGEENVGGRWMGWRSRSAEVLKMLEEEDEEEKKSRILRQGCERRHSQHG